MAPVVDQVYIDKQGKSEELNSCDPPSNLTQIGFKSSFQLGTSSILRQALYINSNPLVIQTGVTVRKHSIQVKIGIFLVPCDLQIWPFLITIEHLFFAASSFVHIYICVCKLELQFVNAEFGSKWIFWAVAFKSDG